MYNKYVLEILILIEIKFSQLLYFIMNNVIYKFFLYNLCTIFLNIIFCEYICILHICINIKERIYLFHFYKCKLLTNIVFADNDKL